MSDTESYRRALDAAVREYERALADRAALDARIDQLKQTIGTLTKLCGLTPTVPWGLTDACRTLLRNAGEPLSAVELKARLSASGFDLDRYANALAAIHTVLKRMAATGQIAPAGDEARVAYEFIGDATAGSPTGSSAAQTRARCRRPAASPVRRKRRGSNR